MPLQAAGEAAPYKVKSYGSAPGWKAGDVMSAAQMTQRAGEPDVCNAFEPDEPTVELLVKLVSGPVPLRPLKMKMSPDGEGDTMEVAPSRVMWSASNRILRPGRVKPINVRLLAPENRT